MKTNLFHVQAIVGLSTIVLFFSLIIPPSANAQRKRVYVERRNPVIATHPVRPYYPVYSSGRRYFYRDGYFYRGGRWGYAVIPAPLGARIRVLPFGFLSFTIGSVPYYYYGGAYYQYVPDQSLYVVVQKPSGAPSTTATDNEDKAVLTDGTTMSGVFKGASEDSVQFEVNGQLKSVPITSITSINFAPSAFDTSAHK